MRIFYSLTVLAALLWPLAGSAQEAPEAGPTKEAAAERAQKLVDGLKFQEGTITLKDGLATVKLNPDFRYLDVKDGRTVLEQIWGNPPDANILGMLMPAGVSPLQDDSWAVIMTFDKSGYVKDDDAAKINYNDLLKEMQKGSAEANPERQKEGYPTIDLLGWATTPHYDAGAKKLYWAKRLKVEGFTEETLNYHIRMLGRRGVLELNAISGMSQLKQVEAATPTILSMVNFNEGHRYADFNSKTDEVAKYGIAALITGGVLAKSGLIKVIIGALVAGKKFVIVAAVGLFAFIKKLITGRSEEKRLSLEKNENA